MHRLHSLICCALLAATVACHGHSTPAPTPTPTSITVTSSGPRLFLGASETFTATITLSDGTTEVATGAVWSTDAAPIATVDATGKVTGRASGTVTVIVDASGLHGTKLIRVLPNYGGSWAGHYGINNCFSFGPVGALAHTCDDLDDYSAGGSFRPATYSFTQTGDSVTGTAVLGFLTATMIGTVAADGSLTFSSTANVGTYQYSETWQLTSTADGALSGSVSVSGVDTAHPTSPITFDCNIFSVVRG